jgi:hypothetical protein
MATPKKKKTITPKANPDVSIGVRQVGSTLSSYNPAFKLGVLDGPDRSYYRKYEYAFRTEPVINRAIKFISLTMLASLGAYTHPEQSIQRFVQENLDRSEGNLQEWLSSLIISALIYGRGNSEILWEPKEGKVFIKDLVNYHPRSIYLVPDMYGRLTNGKPNPYHPTFNKTGVWQELPVQVMNNRKLTGRDKFLNYIRIDMNKMVVVTHNKRFGNYDGESALAPIFLSYQMKTKTWDDLMVTTERYGSPQIAAIVPNGMTSNQIIDPVTGMARPETIAEAAARNLQNMSISTAMVFEEPTGLPGEKIRIQPINTGNNFGDSFLNTMHRLNHEVLLGLGLPPLMFLEQQTGLGSGNITAIQAEAYKQTMVSMYKEFVEPFTEQVIGKLIQYNFGDKHGCGRFEFNPFDIAAAGALGEMVDMALNCGIVDTSEAVDLQLLRARMGFPAINDDSLAKRLRNNKKIIENRINPEKNKMESQLKITEHQTAAQKEIAEGQLEVDKERNDAQLKHQKEVEKMKQQTQIKVAKLKPKPATPKKSATKKLTDWLTGKDKED